jgi:hypothetical protein
MDVNGEKRGLYRTFFMDDKSIFENPQAVDVT